MLLLCKDCAQMYWDVDVNIVADIEVVDVIVVEINVLDDVVALYGDVILVWILLICYWDCKKIEVLKNLTEWLTNWVSEKMRFLPLW